MNNHIKENYPEIENDTYNTDELKEKDYDKLIRNIEELLINNIEWIKEKEEEINNNILNQIKDDFRNNDLQCSEDCYYEDLPAIYIVSDPVDLDPVIDDFCLSDYWSGTSQKNIVTILDISIDVQKIDNLYYNLKDQKKLVL